MAHLQLRYEQLFDLVDQIYEAKDIKELADAFFNGLRPLASFDAAMFMPVNRRTYELEEGYCRGCEPEDMGLYLSQYAPLDPFIWNPETLSQLNEAVRLSDLISQEYLQHGAFGDFCRHLPFQHAMNVLTGWREQPMAAVRLYRREGDFSAAEIKAVNRLAPHLAKAAHLKETALKPVRSRDAGILVFGADQCLVYQNKPAGSMLAGIDPDSILAMTQAGSRWIRTAMGLYRTEIIPLPPTSLLRSLANWTERLPDTLDGGLTVVVVEAFRRRCDVTCRLRQSGLSRREIEVSLGVMRGLSNANIARQLFIDEKTVRDHLQRIYEKTGVHSRTELISRVLGLDMEFAFGKDIVMAEVS